MPITPTQADLGRAVRYAPAWEKDRTEGMGPPRRHRDGTPIVDPQVEATGVLVGLPTSDLAYCKVRLDRDARRGKKRSVLFAPRDLEWIGDDR